MFLFNLGLTSSLHTYNSGDGSINAPQLTVSNVLQPLLPNFSSVKTFAEVESLDFDSVDNTHLSLLLQQNNTNLIFADLAESLPTNSAFFANVSFLLLFLAMTIYWVNLAFFDKKTTSNNTNSNSILLYGGIKQQQSGSAELAVLLKQNLGLARSASPSPRSPKSASQSSVSTSLNLTIKPVSLSTDLKSLGSEAIGKYLIVFSNISLILLLSSRWIESNHFPLSNLYESLMFLSWSCTTIYLILIFTSVKDNLFIEKLIGAILTPCALFLNAFATFSLPKEMQQAGPLVPALQSNWLMMHVTVMIVSYAALILGSLLSIAFLIYCVSKFGINGIDLNSTKMDSGLSLETKTNQLPFKNKIALNLDYLSYRIIGIGFPFLTIGILSGAVWANEAWGSYWSWDPKETWALLTWLVFAIYLHTRFTKGWEGTRPALIAACGFIVVWVCYLGVNLLGEGLHSYGFFSRI
jgi:cytochrome c-type biogenesis protein CcsB